MWSWLSQMVDLKKRKEKPVITVVGTCACIIFLPCIGYCIALHDSIGQSSLHALYLIQNTAAQILRDINILPLLPALH